MLNLQEIRLKKIISEVIRGVSKVKDAPFKFSDFEVDTIYVRHFNMITQSEIEGVYEEHYCKSIEAGIFTEKDQLKYLAENDLWTEENAREIEDKKFYLDGLRKTRTAGAFLKAQQEEFDVLIKKTVEEIGGLELKRNGLIGDTAESLATRRTNDFYILNSVFRDQDCNDRLLSNEKFDDLEEPDIYLLNKINLDVAERLNENSLKKAAISPYFMNFFGLCDNNPQTYYGKPCSLLTFYQIKLFNLGCYYKNILSETGPIDDELMDNPDKLVDRYESSKNAKKIMDNSAARSKGDIAATAIVGMTKEDQKDLGIGGKTIDFMKLAKEKGGKLGMLDMIKAHGAI
jgi:hypothetical protein